MTQYAYRCPNLIPSLTKNDEKVAVSSCLHSKRTQKSSTQFLHRPKTARSIYSISDLKVTDIMVGERGFEPPAPASRRQCSTRLSYSPTDAGDSRPKTGAAEAGAGL